MFRKTIGSLLLALAALVPAAACARVPDARPALWKLADEDTTIYLFGTVHALPNELAWNAGAVRDAFDSAGTLVVEVADDKDAASLAPMLKLGLAEPGSVMPLSERVPEKEREALNALIARTPFPPQAMDRFETWLAALFLVAPTLADAGLDPATGADRVLMASAKERGIAVVGLETTEEQLGYFDKLPEADQRSLLSAVIEEEGSMKEQFQQLIAAWARGDVAALEELADDELKANPNVRKVLLTSRNARWADWIAERMGTPGTVFVAVGAGHLAGDDSVQHMLGLKKLDVERVQ